MTFIQHHDHPTATHKLPRCVFFSGSTKAPEVVRIPGDRALLPPQQPNDFAPTVRSLPHVADFLVAPGGEPQTAKMRIAQFFLYAIGYFWISSLFAETFIDTQIRVKSENHVLQVLFRTNFIPHSLFGPLAALRHHESQPESLIRRFEIAS